MKYSNLAVTPQSEPLPGQIPNNAGGFAYGIDQWKRLDRFLILGSDSPTYYVDERKLTRDNAAVVNECWATDPERTAMQVREISVAGRAPRNDAAIFALALGAAHVSPDARIYALAIVNDVCRTGTHIFQFVDNARALGRGFGRGLKRAVARWYDAKPIADVAYQAIKYRQREGWSHKRLLDLSHPPGDRNRDALYSWIVGKPIANHDGLPPSVRDHLAAMAATTVWEFPTDWQRLPWEALPTWALTSADVWNGLMPTLGLTALIRNLGNLSRLGVIEPLSSGEAMVVTKLKDADAIRRSRLHPFNILQAQAVYASGHGLRGFNTWVPSPRVIDALDAAFYIFYMAFANVEPTSKRIMLALDISGSMTTNLIGGALSARAASAAMALVTLAVEPSATIVGFTAAGQTRNAGWHNSRNYSENGGGISPLAISTRQRLDDVSRYIDTLNFGRTDCALPALYAIEKALDIDAIVIYTDNETWAGAVHPSEAIRRLRGRLNHDVKQIVVGMTSTGFSIAAQDDASSLDLVGFDASAPALISEFIK